ncbi:YvcK family protein [Candidatus Woesebacteria bacterium]|nr:MAG: YvcK family protein [Candidatus Woesebacteria bacterium]
MNKKRIVVIGGGTGTYTVLSGLKKFPVHLTAIVSMMDSGGSNRVLRDEFGLLPTSDIRQCMAALADEKHADSEDLRKLFTYRYENGTGISGMTFGNLFMAALTDVYGTQEKAIEKTCELLHVVGEIIPVTYDNSHLIARYDNGKQVLGEHYVDEPDKETGKHKIVELGLIPKACATKKAIQSIKQADLIVLGPGDLYTSIICNLVVDGIVKAIAKSKAKKVYVVNLMTKFGQTNNFTGSMHVHEINKYLGGEFINYCLIHNKEKIPQRLLRRYKEENSIPVVDDLVTTKKTKIIRKNIMSSEIFIKPKSDIVKRSLVRHDPNKLAKAIVSLV